MKEAQVYTFRIAGVTMDGRQAILKKLRRALKKQCQKKGKFAKLQFGMKLRKVRARLRAEPENEHDPNAIAIDVCSGSRGWLNIGYVPAKTRIGKKMVPLNKIVAVLVKHDLVKEVRLTRLEYFKNEEEELIYFCFITIEYETE